MKKVEVRVQLRREVLDPQGKAILKVLHGLGYDEVQSVRAGKVFTMLVDDSGLVDDAGGQAGNEDEGAIMARAREMAERVLANLVIEDYEISVSESPSSDDAQ